MKKHFLLLALLSSFAACAAQPTTPVNREAAVVADLNREFQQGETGSSLLFWNDEQRRYGFKNLDKFNFSREIPASDAPYPLGDTPQDLSTIPYEVEGKTFTLADFTANTANIGLLVVQNGDVVFERYAPGNDRTSRWVSFSVTKSVTSMLIGAAIKDGYIESVDERVVDHLPRLKNSSYEQATIGDVLRMSSGVAWDETYSDRNSDVSKAGGYNGIQLVTYLRDLPIEEESGVKFNYNTGETNLVGEILRSAIGNNAATYLSTKIWQPFGMESEANWALGGPGGGELGGCCISATLRDYARIGLFAMGDGRLPDGTSIFPDGWMEQSTAPSPGFEGYGYLWWLFGDGAYAARGIFGQQILVDPAKNLVIALHSNAPSAVGSEYHKHIEAALLAIRKAL